MTPEELLFLIKITWYHSLFGKLCVAAMASGGFFVAVGVILMLFTAETQRWLGRKNWAEKTGDPDGLVLTDRDNTPIRPGDPEWDASWTVMLTTESALYMILAGICLLCLGFYPIITQPR